MVVGAAGLGKRALVQHVLRDTPGVCVVRCREGLTFGALGRELRLALVARGDAAGATNAGPSREHTDGQGALGDALGDEGADDERAEDALVDRVLDAAERTSSVVVLEESDLVEAPVIARWLVALMRFARTSRWVVTARTRPSVPGIQEQIVSLSALHPSAARELAEACAHPCSAGQVDAIVRAAEGSPQRIRELAAAAHRAPIDTEGAHPSASAQPSFGDLEVLLHGEDRRPVPTSAPTPERGVSAMLAAELRRRLDGGPREMQRPEDVARSFGVRATVVAGMRLIAEGRGTRGQLVLRTLQQHDEVPSGLGLLSRVAQGLLRVTGGRYTGLTLVSRELLREAESLGIATLYHWAYMFERLVSLSASVSTPEPAWADVIPAPQGISARYLSAVRVAHRARRGEHIADDALPRVEPGDGPLATCVCAFLETHVLLLRGDLEQAEVLAATLVRRCMELRVPLVEGEALLMLCYAQLALARHDELGVSVEALTRVGRSARSRRYTVIADLLRMALDSGPDVQRLLEIARHGDASPTAARVASVLLGGVASGDALDRLLSDGLAARWQATVQPLDPDNSASWVFDPTAGSVWMPQRTEQASPLATRILCCLFDAAASPQGFAPLEDVARVVWDVSDYHPLRDAKRVHVAIRRLRTLIEDDASAPTRLITVDGGYTLGRAELPGRVVSA